MRHTLGSDPEFVLTSNGKVRSAIGIVPGTKSNRLIIGENQFYYDNVMAECAIKPGNSKEETIHNFRECFREYAKIVKPYKLEIKAAVIFPESELQHEDARDVGCKEEWCAYKIDTVKGPINAIKKGNLRSAGGHIHLGTKNDILQEEFGQLFTVRMLDLFLGIPSIYLDWDESSILRRKLYGHAGRHRKPPHGIEYRTIGNYWLASPYLAELVYDICSFVLDFVKNETYHELWTVNKDGWANHCKGYSLLSLKNAINKGDMKGVPKLYEVIEKYMPKKLFEKLIPSKVPNFYKEWNID